MNPYFLGKLNSAYDSAKDKFAAEFKRFFVIDTSEDAKSTSQSTASEVAGKIVDVIREEVLSGDMMSPTQEVLVVPRKIFEGHHSFLDWSFVEGILDELQTSHRWCQRNLAEVSTDWVQPIPCALIADGLGRYCVFRRIKDTRDDLKSKVTLVVGGHVDRLAKFESLRKLLLITLERELEEEVGLRNSTEVRPLGLVIDNSSLLSSRHVAFLYRVTPSHAVVAKAADEFSSRSKYNGIFVTDTELAALHTQLDPWSRLIFEDMIQPPGINKLPRQREFSLDI